MCMSILISISTQNVKENTLNIYNYKSNAFFSVRYIQFTVLDLEKSSKLEKMAALSCIRLMVFSMAIFGYSALSSEKNSMEYRNPKTLQNINVLAVVLPPFTYFNSTHGFYDGIDVRILDIIAKRLQMKLVFTKVNNFTRVSTRKLR